MRILVIGSGGREHAIIWKLLQSKKTSKIFCAPGNGGISEIAECVDISVTDIPKLIEFAKNQRIDFTVVGMDAPLPLGIVDEFKKNNLSIFGPTKSAAILESSKGFAKDFMKKYNIPTASYEIFNNYEKALLYIENHTYPLVIKADGLALGKGVLICQNLQEARTALADIMIKKEFGDSGDTVVIEEFLEGQEVSILSFCDGKTVVPMVSAQDHKRALDDDKGLNTGGMGTFSPSRYYTQALANESMKTIFKPTIDAMQLEESPFTGILFFGLMLTKNGPKVIEYNARFGDPETQVVLPRLKTDLLDILLACESGKLNEVNIEWEDNAAACVVLASGGYPEAYKVGYEISGIERLIASSKNSLNNKEDLLIFHAATKLLDNKFITNGGRVLGITGVANNLDDAIKKAYEGVGYVGFEKMHYRKDIGIK